MCGEAFVLWGSYKNGEAGEKEKESAGHALSIFSIIDTLMGIPRGSLCGGERVRLGLGLGLLLFIFNLSHPLSANLRWCRG